MAQQKPTQPQFGSVSPEELARLDAQYAGAGTPEAAPTAPQKPGTIMDFIRQLVAQGNALPAPLQTALSGAIGAGDFLTNPENRSALAAIPGGLAGGAAGGALVGGPVGALGGAMLGAGTAAFGASKFGEGKSTGEAMKEGAAEAMFEPLGALTGLLGKPMAHMANRFTNTALSPGKDILDKLVDPSTGQKFGNYEDAFKHFGDRALTIQPEGTPGSAAYVKGLQQSNAKDQDLLQWMLNWDPSVRVPEQDLIPAGTWDRLVKDLTQRGTSVDASASLDKAEDIGQSILSRSHVTPSALSPQRMNMPVATAPARQSEWTLPQLDQLQKGLQDDLHKFYDRKASAGMSGQKIPADDELEARVMEILRGNVSGAVKNNTPTFPDLPTAGELQGRISERIPYTKAAVDATYELDGSPFRVRLANSSGTPKAQVFHYFGKKGQSALARPLKKGAEMVPTASHVSPSVARILAAIMSTHGGQKNEPQ